MMKHLLLTTIAAVLVGCGESQQSVRQAKAQPEPTTAKAPNISILEAVAAGNIAVVKQHLADKTYHESFEFQRLLNVAVLEGHKEIAELLISKGADVNAKNNILGRTPLIEAIHGNQIDLIELLIAKEADVNLQYGHETPLDLAKGNKEIYDLLRKHGGKTSEELKAAEPSNVSIHRAVVNGNIEAVKQHLAAGEDVNANDENSLTPLDWAFVSNEIEIADLLREHGGKTKRELEAAGN